MDHREQSRRQIGADEMMESAPEEELFGGPAEKSEKDDFSDPLFAQNPAEFPLEFTRRGESPGQERRRARDQSSDPESDRQISRPGGGDPQRERIDLRPDEEPDPGRGGHEPVEEHREEG